MYFLDSSCICRIALDVCSKAQGELAKEKAMYEMFVDDHIVAPLQTLVEVSCACLS